MHKLAWINVFRFCHHVLFIACSCWCTCLFCSCGEQCDIANCLETKQIGVELSRTKRLSKFTIICYMRSVCECVCVRVYKNVYKNVCDKSLAKSCEIATVKMNPYNGPIKIKDERPNPIFECLLRPIWVVCAVWLPIRRERQREGEWERQREWEMVEFINICNLFAALFTIKQR